MMDIQAIDVHAHFGKSVTQRPDFVDEWMSGGLVKVVQRAELSNTCMTIVSPLTALMPRFSGDSVTGNKDAFASIPNFPEIRQWVVVDPLKPETYTQAEEMLKHPHCVGIKIHPEEHGYHITEYGTEIFEFAEKNETVIQSHSGEKNSLPEDFVEFANGFPTVKLIVSHLGCGFDNDPSHQVKAIQKSRHGNMFTDTSSAMSMTPRLIEWAVKEIGAERILYGTDSPLYFAPMQRARIDYAEISENDKKLILRENAITLFKQGVQNDKEQ